MYADISSCHLDVVSLHIVKKDEWVQDKIQGYFKETVENIIKRTILFLYKILEIHAYEVSWKS